MKCPTCGYEMPVKKTNMSYGDGGKTYDRVQYVCTRCDVWVLLETPVAETEE